MKILEWNQLSELQQKEALQRPAQKRNDEFERTVRKIVSEVRYKGDSALLGYTRLFDCPSLKKLKVTDVEFREAAKKVPQAVKVALKKAAANIEKFHQAQTRPPLKVETMPGVSCALVTRPIERVGLYIPGGSAPLPSTMLMLGIPSKLAGCPVRIACSPPGKNGKIPPVLLFTAALTGIRDFYKMGGAQAIAAMAFGTKSVPKVDKICGPGNAFVTEAKVLVSQDPIGASIDMPAGPSEVLVLADRNANPVFVAADLLSQAEHDPQSQVLLVTNSRPLADLVSQEVSRQLEDLPRVEIARRAVENGAVILVSSIEEGIAISNAYAPEHLILQVQNPRRWVDKIIAAGSVFLGPYTPESVGDYASGTNHVLPTYGWARSFGGVNLASFYRTMTVQELSREGLKRIGKTVETLAACESLEAHRRAVSLRLNGDKS